MPSRPQSVAWLFARDMRSNPIDLRSFATAGEPMIQTPPNSACGTAGVRVRSIAVPFEIAERRIGVVNDLADWRETRRL